MIEKIIPGIIRHILTVVGGSFVTEGWLTDNELNSLIGAILTLIGVGWSIWQKSKTRTVPGGEFNPNAKVEKAKPVQGNIKNGLIALALIPAFMFGGCVAPDMEHAAACGHRVRAAVAYREALESGSESRIREARSRYDWSVGWVQGYEAAKK